jgi:penicillin-insensitive murein endopeptidase
MGLGYVRFREHAPTYFGLPRLVRAIERAAAAVEQGVPGGAPLVVGDLGAETGGKIPRHNSHRTGRDVDFLFYLTRPNGIPLRNPGFIPLGADGFVKLPDDSYALIDVQRQWLLFKTLITDSEIDVQFLFMSRALEARVMDYALSKESDLALLWHAQTVMLQPGDSLPHADHVHMRIACKPEEAVSGCSGGGPHWPWLESFPFLEVPIEQLLVEIQQSDPFSPDPLMTEEIQDNRLVDAQANSDSNGS